MTWTIDCCGLSDCIATAVPPTYAFACVPVKGKTDRCLPKGQYREAADAAGFFTTQTENHWADATSMAAWVQKVLAPYVKATKEKEGVAPDHPWLLMVDCWAVHLTEEFRVS
jgi:hypothetical protein